MKTIVYIDGQNFLYRAAEILIEAGVINDKRELYAIDIPYILRKVGIEGHLDIRYYGVAKISQKSEYGEEMLEKSRVFLDNLRRLKGYLGKHHMKYRGTGVLKIRDTDTCKKCGTTDYKYIEKGVDVGLAVDITQDVIKKHTNRVVLLSSDTDLTPALKVARKEKVKITYVAFDGQVTRSLARLASDIRVMQNKTITEAYIRTLN